MSSRENSCQNVLDCMCASNTCICPSIPCRVWLEGRYYFQVILVSEHDAASSTILALNLCRHSSIGNIVLVKIKTYDYCVCSLWGYFNEADNNPPTHTLTGTTVIKLCKRDSVTDLVSIIQNKILQHEEV